jgi:HK97 gp10 family phage protein
MSFEVKGDKELIAKLKALGGTEAKKACKRATRSGAKIILQAARSTAPERSGALRRSMKLRQRTKKNTVTTAVTAKIYYGAFQEFGTKKMKGQHFIEDATDRTADAALSQTLDELKSEIEKAVK